MSKGFLIKMNKDEEEIKRVLIQEKNINLSGYLKKCMKELYEKETGQVDPDSEFITKREFKKALALELNREPAL